MLLDTGVADAIIACVAIVCGTVLIIAMGKWLG